MGGSYTTYVWAAITPIHPRLILTDTKLTELRAKACYDENGNQISGCTPTNDWKIFINWISPYVTSGSTYGMQAWHFALVYMVTKDTAYAQRAISLVDKEIANGMTEERFDSYLRTREYVGDAALVYDWLNSLLSPSQKDTYVKYMNQILTEIWNPFDNPYNTWSGWAINDPGNNYYYNFLLTTGYAGLATYNENPNPPSLPFRNKTYTDILEFLYAKINLQAVPEWLDTRGKEGGWHEGENYGLVSKWHMFDLFSILKNAGGVNYFSTLNFPKESLYYQLYTIQPGNQYEYPGGDLARESTMSVSSYDRVLMLLLADGLAGATESQYAQYWLNNIYPSMQWRFMYPWDFLLYRPNLPQRDFRELPLNYYAEGLGWINSRSGWTDDAVSVSFVSADMVQSHQHQDQNSFVIYKNGWQAIDANTYSRSGIVADSYAHNTFLIDSRDQRYGDGTGSIQKFEASTDYTYVVGDASDAYYGGTYGRKDRGDPPLLDTFIRELVHILPDYVIVFDRISAVNPSTMPTYLLQFRNQPSVSGNLVTATNDNGGVLQRTLLPSNFNVNVADMSISNSDLNSWRVDIEPSTPQSTNYFLNVFYVTDSTTTSMPNTTLIDSTNMTGALILDPTTPQIVLFSKVDLEQTTVTYEATYTETGKHLITGLASGTYDVYKNGTKILSDLSISNKGTLYFESTGGSTFQIVQTGFDTIPPAPPQGLERTE